MQQRINAYILAADPTWLTRSVSAYYPHVNRLVVSFDSSGHGWTGAPIRVEECRAALAKLDVERKITLLPGTYARIDPDPLVADTVQRQDALNAASDDAEWVLQVDTDELLPQPTQLLDLLAQADPDVQSVEWPMRVLYRRLRDGRYLEVCGPDGDAVYEYPGPVAARAGATLSSARRAHGPWLRPILPVAQSSIQVHRDAEPEERRVTLPEGSEAILHNSWARSPADVRRKIAAWGHNEGLRSWKYYGTTWLPAPYRWSRLRNVHPISGATWPALRPVRLDA